MRQLNPSQQAAVEHDLGPLLVLAGAGSGKTSVVTRRIARLMERGVSAKSVLAVTFTNKAAGEMRERVATLVGAKKAKELTVSTFHRFGLDVLSREAKALGFRDKKFVVFDQADASGVVREVLRNIRDERNYDIGAILARISSAKNAFVPPEEFEGVRKGQEDPYDEITKIVYARYIEALQGFHALDFDDLICEVVRLWRRREEILAKWRKRYRYLIVDEYQDTNQAQLEMVRLLGGEHRNVCVVGDDDQSIYAWRGADVRNILEFEEHFPGAKVVKLQENYRSRTPILQVANAVLEKATGKRHEKTIIPTQGEGERVRSVVALDPEIESKFVARTIAEGIEAGRRPKHYAILYRSNLQAADIEAALKERQVPYQVFGGTQFFERKEVKDLLAYLRVAVEPKDELALRRIINYPARGIGPAALERLTQHAVARDKTLWSAVLEAQTIADLPNPAKDGCRMLVHTLGTARQAIEGGMESARVARNLCEAIDLKGDINAGSPNNQAAARRWSNIERIVRVFERRDGKAKTDIKTLGDFLRLLSLREESDEEEANDKVTLTTVHGAKGLEFDIVFFVGLEEGLMPHARAQNERVTDVPLPGDGSMSIDEERRLFYVAVTRARHELYLTRCQHRAMRGKLEKRTPSRFLLDVPEELLDVVEELEEQKPTAEQTMAGAAAVLAAINFDVPDAPMRRS